VLETVGQARTNGSSGLEDSRLVFRKGLTFGEYDVGCGRAGYKGAELRFPLNIGGD